MASNMFKRSFANSTSTSARDNYSSSKVTKAGSSKASKPAKRSFTHQARLKLQQFTMESMSPNNPVPPSQPSPVITLTVGPEARLFACHADVLSQSPFFAAVIRSQYYDNVPGKRIELPDEEPEVFSSVLEFLYKGDYYPRLVHQENRLKRASWTLEDALEGSSGSNNKTAAADRGKTMGETGANGGGGNNKPTGSSTFFHGAEQGMMLKDTAIYCSAERYGLEELQRIALRKQGLRTAIPVDVILRSARYAYENTPEHDAKLRAHFLALIIRSRRTFKRSGTMQMEMEAGGSKLFFDLFVAMCNHIDDITELTSKASPRTV